MQGFSPKLPLTRDKQEGLYLMNKTASESIRQDLKMLVLTSPGERVMLPEYGVGLRRLLFEQNVQATRTQILDKIRSQVKIYMNFIQIDSIDVSQDNLNENLMNVQIIYKIPTVTANLQELSFSVNK